MTFLFLFLALVLHARCGFVNPPRGLELVPHGYGMWENENRDIRIFALDRNTVCEMFVDESDEGWVKYRIRKPHESENRSSTLDQKPDVSMGTSSSEKWSRVTQLPTSRFRPEPALCFWDGTFFLLFFF